MEQSNTRKAVYIAISLFVSLLIWFSASGNAEVVINVNNIPVEFLNETTSLAEKGLMRIGTEDPSVDLTLRMTRSNVFKLNTDEIRVVADLGGITAPGMQSINYIILYPNNVSSSEIKVESPSVRTVLVNIGELFRKEVEVRYEVIGSVSDGYLAGAVSLSPRMLEVRGQQEDIVNVNYALVKLDVSNATSTIVELLEYELYDFNDQPISSALIHPTTDNIQVVMPVKKVKEIPVRIDLVEAPGVRLENIDHSLSADTITLSGEESVLDGLEELNLGTVFLADHEGTQSLTYPITIPEELENLSGITEVTLTLSYKDIVTTSFNAVRFEQSGLSSDQEVDIITSSLPVTLRGTSAELAGISAENIVVTADLSDISAAAGVYTVPARIHVESEADVGAVGTYQVTVRIEEMVSET